MVLEIGETLGGEEVGAAYFSNFSIENLRTNPTTGLETSSGTGLVITSGEFDAFPCFADGSLIDPVDGPRAVERLRINDRVVLASGGSVPVVWTGSRRQGDGLVVRIRAGALGRRVPTRDLIVSSDHGLYLDSVLVQAGLLVNGETIVAEHRHEVTFWHVELERHGILLAEGLPAESYLDTGNRRQFSNCALGYDSAALGKEPYAEMVFAGKRLDIIRARLKAPVPR